MSNRKQLTVGDDSSNPPPTILRNLEVEYLTVHVQRLSDAARIASCRAVGKLELWGWKHEDLTPLEGLAVRWFGWCAGDNNRSRASIARG